MNMEIEEEFSIYLNIIPKDFRIGGVFMMSGMYFMHVGMQRAVIISFEEGGDVSYGIC